MRDDSSPKLCECGCGLRAPISKTNRPERGQRKGEPVRFILGHAQRGLRHTDEARAKIAAASLGRTHSDETKRKQSEIKRGSKNPYWKGGRMQQAGYTLVRVGTEHPMANSSGYAMEHRLVVAAEAGRTLGRYEYVHHIDLDTTNNALSNLILVSPREHSRLHRLVDQTGLTPAQALATILSERAA